MNEKKYYAIEGAKIGFATALVLVVLVARLKSNST
jgi:hypothetical protein